MLIATVPMPASPASIVSGQGLMNDALTPNPRSFLFGEFSFSPERQSLLRGATPIRIGGRALDLLTALVERPGQLVDKQELISRAWPSTFVEDTNLKVNISSLRRALGESNATRRYIATVAGRGYRFIAPVRLSAPAPAVAAGPGSIAGTQINRLLETLDAIRRGLVRFDALASQHEMRLELDEATACSDGDRMRAIVYAQLREQLLQVCLDGVGRHPQLPGDLLVSLALSDQSQDREVAVGQPLIQGMGRERMGDIGADDPAPRMHRTDRIDQILADAVLE